MKKRYEVTRSEFIQAIKAFKQLHGKKLKQLLNNDNPEAVKEFWSNPVIRAWLRRPSVDFIDLHPHLKDSSNKNEHANSDHYELKVYKYLPKDVFYRDQNVAQPEFYLSGTTTLSNLSSEGYKPDDTFVELVKSQCLQNDDIRIKVGIDIYKIVADIASYRATFQEKPRPRFLIYSQSKDAHATTIVSVIEPTTGRSLASIFINSWNKLEFFDFINSRYSMEHNLDSDSMPDSLKQIVTRKDMEENTEIETNSAEKYAYTWYSPDVGKQRQILSASRDIDTYYIMDPEHPRYPHKFALTSPLIDASHNLQLEKNDGNCALYSLNFIKAITYLLSDPAVRDRVYSLAESVKKDPAAEQELTSIFQEELRKFLPQYYNQDTQKPASMPELQAFHLKQRWFMGSLSISLKHPLESVDKLQHNPSEYVKIGNNTPRRDAFFKFPERPPQDKIITEEQRAIEISDADIGSDWDLAMKKLYEERVEFFKQKGHSVMSESDAFTSEINSP
jgi:hypothetical protein